MAVIFLAGLPFPRVSISFSGRLCKERVESFCENTPSMASPHSCMVSPGNPLGRQVLHGQGVSLCGAGCPPICPPSLQLAAWSALPMPPPSPSMQTAGRYLDLCNRHFPFTEALGFTVTASSRPQRPARVVKGSRSTHSLLQAPYPWPKSLPCRLSCPEQCPAPGVASRPPSPPACLLGAPERGRAAELSPPSTATGSTVLVHVRSRVQSRLRSWQSQQPPGSCWGAVSETRHGAGSFS